MSEKFAVPISIVIAGGLIAGAFYFSNIKAASLPANVAANTGTQQAPTGEMRPISADEHILGNPNAEIIMVEYSDTECPFCKMFHPTLQRVMNEYGADGKVAWAYRHFPIAQLHAKAQKEAEASECAHELGGNAKFWEYLNMVYDKTQSNDSLDPAELPKFATAIGLDTKAFTECLASGRHAAKVQADYDDAIKVGARGTPYTILISKDGTKTPVEGAQSYEAVKATIDALLQ